MVCLSTSQHVTKIVSYVPFFSSIIYSCSILEIVPANLTYKMLRATKSTGQYFNKSYFKTKAFLFLLKHINKEVLNFFLD